MSFADLHSVFLQAGLLIESGLVFCIHRLVAKVLSDLSLDLLIVVIYFEVSTVC